MKNDSAFPNIESDYDTFYGHQQEDSSRVISEITSSGGLTKREYFACAAMQALLANPSLVLIDSDNEGCLNAFGSPPHRVGYIAIKYADAVLVELEKNNDA